MVSGCRTTPDVSTGTFRLRSERVSVDCTRYRYRTSHRERVSVTCDLSALSVRTECAVPGRTIRAISMGLREAHA
eukprot:2577039-Rhodomonas_salina.1